MHQAAKPVDSGNTNVYRMVLPNKEEKEKHDKIFENIFNPELQLTSNAIIQGSISTIIFDGDFAKNDCDDIWGLSFLLKHLSQINGNTEKSPELQCGFLHGSIEKPIKELPIAVHEVYNRNLPSLNGNILVYVLGGINQSEYESYKSMVLANKTCKFTFIFQAPSTWNYSENDEKHSVPSNVRAGQHLDKNKEEAIKSMTINLSLIDFLHKQTNTKIVFTDFERPKRRYNVLYNSDGTLYCTVYSKSKD